MVNLKNYRKLQDRIKDPKKDVDSHKHDRLHESVITDDNAIVESYAQVQDLIESSSSAAYRLGLDHGKNGNLLPKKNVEKRFGDKGLHYYTGIEDAKRAKTEPNKGLFITVAGKLKRKMLGEEVRRKYIGKTRGTTATGKKAHAIDTDPHLKVKTGKELNRTIPSISIKK